MFLKQLISQTSSALNIQLLSWAVLFQHLADCAASSYPWSQRLTASGKERDRERKRGRETLSGCTL